MDPREIAKLINEDFDELTPTIKGKAGGPRKLFFEGAEASPATKPLGDPEIDGDEVSPEELPNLDIEAPADSAPIEQEIDQDQGILEKDAKMGELAALSSNMKQGLSSAEQGEKKALAQTTATNNAATAKDAEDAAIINNFELATQKQQAAQDEAKRTKEKIKARFGSDNVEDAKKKLISKLATGEEEAAPAPTSASIPEWRVNFNDALNEAFFGPSSKELPGWVQGGQRRLTPPSVKTSYQPETRAREESFLRDKVRKLLKVDPRITPEQISDNLRISIKLANELIRQVNKIANDGKSTTDEFYR